MHAFRYISRKMAKRKCLEMQPMLKIPCIMKNEIEVIVTVVFHLGNVKLL